MADNDEGMTKYAVEVEKEKNKEEKNKTAGEKNSKINVPWTEKDGTKPFEKK